VERFEQFRLSLMPPAQNDLFSGPPPSREEYIRSAFGREWKFDHYKSPFTFVHKGDLDPATLLGQIGREGLIRENRSPEEKFEDNTHIGWLACVVLIDPTDHEDGQKVAVQVDPKVGTPLSLIDALVRTINERVEDKFYHIEVEPIIEATPFWEFVEKNNGEITSITFELVVPNGLFTANNDTAEEMRRFKEVMKTRKLTVTLQNSDGLDIYSDPIKDAVDYAANSGGRIRAKSKSGKKYSSATKPKATTIEADENDAGDSESLLVRAAQKVAEIFGR